jgi:hypothetical protein
MTLPLHYVTFSAAGIGDVSCLRDEDSPNLVGGYGGWDIVTRPRKVGLTQWNGREPFQMDIPILFDGFHGDNGQEIEISKLSRMALPGGDDEPPIVKIKGPGVPDPGPDNWVIRDISWGTQKVMWAYNDAGVMTRMRQDAVVHVMEHVAPDRAAFAKLASKGNQGAWPKHYTVKKGDTLSKIAAKFYKNSKKWKKIADANNIRDPKSLKVGRRLVIPKP